MARQAGGTLDQTVYALTVMIMVFFMAGGFVYCAAAILFVLLSLVAVRARGKIRCPWTVGIMAGYILLVLIQILAEPSVYYDFKTSVKELSRLFTYMVVILISANVRVRKESLLRLWYSVFVVTLIIALLQYTKAFGINDVLASVYEDGVDLEIARKYSTLDLFRAGSVFVNSNTYAKFALMFLGIFMTLGQEENMTLARSVLTWLAIGVTLLLTGSRTGLIVSVIMILTRSALSVALSRFRVSVRALVAFTCVLVMLAAGIIVSITGYVVHDSPFRTLRVAAGFGDSLAVKAANLTSMIHEFGVLNLFIGMGPFEHDLTSHTFIDFDLGYVVAFYGIAGVVLYALLVCDLYYYRKRINPRFASLNASMVLVFVLFGLTGGMMMHLRVFSLLCMIAFVDVSDTGRFGMVHPGERDSAQYGCVGRRYHSPYRVTIRGEDSGSRP